MRSLKKRKWTVFFLIRSVDTEMSSIITILDRLMMVHYPEEIAVILGINFNRKNFRALMERNDKLTVKNDEKPDFTTMFFRITTVERGHKNALTIIGRKKDFNLAAEKDISEFFRNKILRHYRAKRYLLFTWDHGTGFSIFNTSNQFPFPQLTGGIDGQDPESPVLTTDELSEAIFRATGAGGIHLTIMMNCTMQVFDTAYDLRHNTKYLIAPQTSIGVLDYYYTQIFSYLAKKPDTSPRKLAAYIIRSFQKNADDVGYARKALLSVCRLRHIHRMAYLMDRLGALLYYSVDVNFVKIRIAFRKATEVGDDLIDLYSLLTLLRHDATKKEQAIIDDLFVMKDFAYPQKYIGAEMQDWVNLTGNPLHGVSIASPIGERAGQYIGMQKIKAYPLIFMNTTFLEETRWGMFIKKLRELDIKNP